MTELEYVETLRDKVAERMCDTELGLHYWAHLMEQDSDQAMKARRFWSRHADAALSLLAPMLAERDEPDHVEWHVFYGGPDPDNAAGRELRDGEADATEHLQWMNAGAGVGVARRAVHYGLWEVTHYLPPVEDGDS